METNRTESALEALLDIFEAELSNVSFPDLRVETLRAAERSVEHERRSVEVAENALTEASRVLDDSRSAFVRLGRKAVAYAQVYADGSAELSERLAGIARDLNQPATRAEPQLHDSGKRRGRPRKTDTSLFDRSATSEGLVVQASSPDVADETPEGDGIAA